MSEAFIGVDWGSTNLRAYLIGENAEILDKKADPRGFLSLTSTQYPEVLRELIGDWLAERPGIEIFLAGMVGASGGWKEAEYLYCPFQIDQMRSLLVRVDFDSHHSTYIVPGLAQMRAGDPDVMRGEETQLLGTIDPNRKMDVICLPGTHSKWVNVERMTVQSFRTFMTGELFSILEKHSILSSQLEHSEIDENAFKEGVATAKCYRGLLTDLFKVRAAGVLGQRDINMTYGYLSGLLIGYEIMGARDFWQSIDDRPLKVVAAEPMAKWYVRAFAEFGCCNGVAVDPELAIAKGFFQIVDGH